MLEYGSIIHGTLKNSGCLLVWSIQRTFTRYVLRNEGFPYYMERCHTLALETFWMRCLELNLAIYWVAGYRYRLCLSLVAATTGRLRI